MKRLFFGFVSAALLGGIWSGALASAATASPWTILLLPFSFNAAGDMSYLKKGIEDMLTSRLASEQISVITTADIADGSGGGPHNQAEALSLARKAGADYIVMGSITIVGNQLSTDARCIQSDTGHARVMFNESGARIDDVIGHINSFAGQIKQSLTGTAESDSARAPQAAAAPDSDAVHRSPEKLIPEARQTPQQPMSESQTAQTGAEVEFTAWRSSGFDQDIASIDVGDMDGDGRMELVAVSGNQVRVYRFENQRLAQVGTIPVKGRVTFFSVHVGDIDSNGKTEIFLTRLDNRTQPFIDVYEWDGGQYAKTAELREWFLSTVERAGHGGRRLIGQKKTPDGYDSAIYEFEHDGKGYSPTQRLNLPGSTNIHGFAWMLYKNQGAPAVIAFTPNEYLRLYDAAGEVIWSSSEQYGGSTAYFDHTPMESPEKLPERTFLNPKIRVADTDGNGLAEIVVASNEDSSGGFFSKVRLFKSGHLEILEAGLTGARVKWKSADIAGHIHDLAVGDLDGDGRVEIVSVVHPRNPLLEKKEKSYLLIWQKTAD